MKTRVAEKCRGILDRIWITKKFEGVGYIFAALEEEIEKNEWRSECIQNAKAV